MEHTVQARDEAFCPICLEGFHQGHEVLLSCSHMFHRACLQNFEQFMRVTERTCPICRTTNYQKKITHVGSRAFEQVCARRVQSLWRGFCVRREYYEKRRAFYSSIGAEARAVRGYVPDPRLRNKFYQGELTHLASQLESTMTAHGAVVDHVLSSSESVMKEGRELDNLFDSMLRSRGVDGWNNYGADEKTEESSTEQPRATSGAAGTSSSSSHARVIDWNAVLERALKRGLDECVVCLGPLATSTRRVTLLSCSHAFHENCMKSIERYGKGDSGSTSTVTQRCCVCREIYSRRCLDKTCTRVLLLD